MTDTWGCRAGCSFPLSTAFVMDPPVPRPDCPLVVAYERVDPLPSTPTRFLCASCSCSTGSFAHRDSRLRFGAFGRCQQVELWLVLLRVLHELPLVRELPLVGELQCVKDGPSCFPNAER